MVKRLKAKALARKTTKPGGEMIYDGMVKGLGFKKLPSGIVTAFLRYGSRNRRRFLGLGRLGEDFTLEDARRLATKTLGMVADGKDPVAERAAGKVAATTFPMWAATYLERTDRLRKEKAQPRFYLAFASKKWARRGLDSITKSDVLNLRDALATEGARIGAKRERDDHQFDGHPRANRWLAHVAACFKAAVDENLIPLNPARGIKMLPENPPRARVLDDGEMERLIVALENEDEFTATVFHVLLETGCRVSEILRAKWADVDLDGGTWRLPSPKAGHPQMIPLAGATIERLEKLPRINEYVVPAGSDLKTHRADAKRGWARLKEKARLGDAHIHDLRRSFGLAVARQSGLHVASRLLRHRDVRITASVYTPLDLNMQREATEARARLLVFPRKKGAAK